MLSEERKKELEYIFYNGDEDPVGLTEEEHEYWGELLSQYLRGYLSLLSRIMQADAAAKEDKRKSPAALE